MAKIEDVNIFDLETLVNPYEAYQVLRNEAPVFYVPELNIHYVTRYDLIRGALKDTKTFSSQFDSFLNLSREAAMASMPADVQQALKMIERKMVAIPPTMLTLDEPDHTKYRSLVSQLFTGSLIKQSEAQVQSIVQEEIAKLTASTDELGSVDFMSAFAFAVPLRVIADRLGIPSSERTLFDEAAIAAAAGLRLSPQTPDEMLHRAQLALDLQHLMVDLIEARRQDPRDDMITLLANSRLEDSNRMLTHGEALSILNQFLVAGHETTASTFGWGMLMLCERPELQAQIQADIGLVKTFVEEALRIESPVQGLPRVATTDTSLGGYPIKAGEFVMLRYGSANRDERQFEDPDRVNLQRQKAGMQLAFGSGVHHCIGAPLARQELNLGFASLLQQMQNFRLSPQHPQPQAQPSFILRNLPQLHICFDVHPQPN